MKKIIFNLLLVFTIISCSTLKNDMQDTYDVISIVLSEEIEKKKDSINLFIVVDVKGAELYKMLHGEKIKTDHLFKDFLNHHDIPINFEEEKTHFKGQIVRPLILDLKKIEPKKLSLYQYSRNQKEKSKYFDPEFRKNSFYLVRPIFTKDKKYAIMYQRINDHIFYCRIFHKKNNIWKQVRVYNSSRIIVDGAEVDLF